MSSTILIINKSQGNNFEELTTSEVVIQCDNPMSIVIKDRIGRAFHARFHTQGLNDFINAVYPEYVINDCRISRKT